VIVKVALYSGCDSDATVLSYKYKGGFILRVRQRCDERLNCCDAEVILLRNPCFFVASLLSCLVRVAFVIKTTSIVDIRLI
jgi:hypothetical protein